MGGANGAGVVAKRPNTLMRGRAATQAELAPFWGKPIEEILAEQAAAVTAAASSSTTANSGTLLSSLKRERTTDGDAADEDEEDEVCPGLSILILVLIFVQRTAKKHKLSADDPTVEDLEEVVEAPQKRRVRWAEFDHIIGGEPEPMLPPGSMDGFRPGRWRYMTASGVTIQAVTPKGERRRRRKSGRRYKVRNPHSTVPTVEVAVEGAENDQGEDEPQGEHGGEKDEEEEVDAEEVEDDEDGLVTEFRATFSPPPNWYDEAADESELSEDEMSLDA